MHVLWCMEDTLTEVGDAYLIPCEESRQVSENMN